MAVVNSGMGIGPAALLLALAACSAEPGVANATTAPAGATMAAPDADMVAPGTANMTAPAQGAAVPGAAKPGNEQFADFWQRFRQAALGNDAATIVAASAPRVTTHGILDSDPGAEVAAAKVPALVAQALASDETIDASGRTLRQVLANATAPKRAEGDPLGYRRVGALVFEQVKGRWFLTEIYVEE